MKWPAMLWVALCAAACSEPIDKPEAPDMSALIAAYESPDGTLDGDSAGAVGRALDTTFDALGSLCGWEQLAELVCAVDDARCIECAALEPVLEALELLDERVKADAGMAAGEGADDLSSKIEGEGFFRLERICPGGEQPPVADRDRNGVMSLVVGFTEEGIDPVVFGRLDDCLIPDLDGGTMRVSGELDLAFGEPPTVRNLASLAPIVQLAGALERGQDRDEVDASLRIGASDGAGLQFLVESSDAGEVVLELDADGAAIRASNGRFPCDLAARTCDDGEGGVLSL